MGEPAQTPEPDKRVIHPLALQALNFIADINAIYTQPTILITGSFSRWLQGISDSFKDIDTIGTNEAYSHLIARLYRQLHNPDNNEQNDEDTGLTTQVLATPISGCEKIRLPFRYDIILSEGDLGRQAMHIEGNIYSDLNEQLHSGDILPIYLTGLDRPVNCLSFDAEVRQMLITLGYLTSNLAALTEEIKNGKNLIIPRNLIFYPQDTVEQKMHALLMRCMMTLNVAEKFQTLLAEGKTGLFCTEQQARNNITNLRQSIGHLEEKLYYHSYCDSFSRALADWYEKQTLIRKEYYYNPYKEDIYHFVKAVHDRLIPIHCRQNERSGAPY